MWYRTLLELLDALAQFQRHVLHLGPLGRVAGPAADEEAPKRVGVAVWTVGEVLLVNRSDDLFGT